MDAASLALSIAALYTTCRDCYNFFTAVKTAEVESSAHLRELEIQQSILKAWGFHWQIQDQDGSELELPDHTRRKRTKLHKYLLSNRFKAEGVFKTLSALADTLSNQEKLIKRYGIQLQPATAIEDGSQSTNNVQLAIPNTTIEDVKPVIGEIKSRLSVLRKFKWALKDRDSFKKLILDLKSLSESLYRLCPENAFEAMNIYLTMECLAKQESPAGLKWTSRLATQQAEIDEDSSVREGYELLASAATLKAAVNENRGGEQADDTNLITVDEEQQGMFYLGKGLALFEEQVVYVEMRDYRGPPLEPTPEQKKQMKRRRNRVRFKQSLPTNSLMTPHYSMTGIEQIYEDSSSDESQDDKQFEVVRPADPKLRALIRNFFNTFQGLNMRESVHGLDIAGMIDHTEGEHKGHCSILYKLPSTIGVQSRERPAENLKLRAPVTLQSLLGTKQKEGIRSTLGARFELARKLVRAVCLLHSSGWLHKNIRAESVMFFPEHVSALREDRYEMKIEIDVSKPILMGYIFSRPDDVTTRIQPPPTLPHPSAVPQLPHPSALPHPSMPANGDEPSSTAVWVDPMDESAKWKRKLGTPRNRDIYGRDMSGKIVVPEQPKERKISGFTLDYYQHPAKHADPKRLYRHAYDVYSLGILLLEVGLWEELKDYEKACEEAHRDAMIRSGQPYYGYNGNPEYEKEDHYERRRWICRTYLDRLRWACGDTYADVVLSCLMIDSSDDEVAKASERELCARIVADLEGCQA
jgi:serine/threonine protein kinase